MKARLENVPAGTSFRTSLTGRAGVVLAHEDAEVVVRIGHEIRRLHTKVVVDADEVTH